jgi:hypothetical protein
LKKKDYEMHYMGKGYPKQAWRNNFRRKKEGGLVKTPHVNINVTSFFSKYVSR